MGLLESTEFTAFPIEGKVCRDMVFSYALLYPGIMTGTQYRILESSVEEKWCLHIMKVRVNFYHNVSDTVFSI